MNTQQMSSALREPAQSGAIPGVVAAAADASGTIFEAGFGTRDVSSGVPMTPDTVVWIASMTKAVTGSCAMQLVEQGKLSLNDPIATVLPELGRVQVLEGFDAAGKPRLRAARQAITLRQLLTHTAGFAYDLWNAEIARYMEATGTPGIITCQNAALTLPLIADPGERWEYGISIDWVGKAVEAVSGIKLDRYMRENLFEPLGMSDTTFRITDEQRKRLAKIHSRASEGIVATDTELPQDPEFHMGGGGLYSTVGDYLKFTQMILHAGRFNGVQVLRPETVAMMSSNAMGNLVCNPMRSAVPWATNDVEFLAGMKWGLSFLINPDMMATGRSAGSLAWAGLANSYYWIDPARKVTGVFATQLLPFFDAQAVAAFQDFESAVYAAL